MIRQTVHYDGFNVTIAGGHLSVEVVEPHVADKRLLRFIRAVAQEVNEQRNPAPTSTVAKPSEVPGDLAVAIANVMDAHNQLTARFILLSQLISPFCLTDGEERLIELWDIFDAGHIAHIHCTHCGADGPSVYGEMGAAPTIARARSMWNGRAEYLKTPNAELTGAPLGAPGARRPFARPVE